MHSCSSTWSSTMPSKSSAARGPMFARSAGHVAAVVFKQQAVPLAQRVVVEVEARVLLEVRCAPSRLAGLTTLNTAVGPAVQGAHDVAARAAAAGFAAGCRGL